MIRYILRNGWERLYYVLSAYVLILQIDLIRWQAIGISRADWVFPFNFFPISSGSIYLLLFQVCCAGFILSAFLPKLYPPLALVLWIIALALINSFGKSSNSCDGFVLAALGMTLAGIIDSKDKKLRLSYALVASTYIYAAAGLWKLRFLLAQPDFLQAATMNLPYNIAYGLGESYRDAGRIFLDFFVNRPWISAFTWLATLTLQACIPIGVIFLEKWRVVFCFALICFHMSTYLVIGTSFWPQIYLLALFGAEIFYGQASSYLRMTSARRGK